MPSSIGLGIQRRGRLAQHALCAGISLFCTVAAGPTPGERKLRDVASPDVPLATILDRAGEYVGRYSETFQNVLAEETSRQWLRGGYATPSDVGIYGTANPHQRTEIRTLRSELVWVAVPGLLPWGAFRDVVELDGRKLGDHEGRLAELFASPAPGALAQAREIFEESSRYNLGARRDVNVPTRALLLLLPENQRRLELERKGERTIANLRRVEVEFREVSSPTLVRDQGRDRDVPSRGRFWIDPTRGAVLRSEIQYVGRGFVSTEYRTEPGFDVLVPDVMTEVGSYDGSRLESTARYPRYRRFGAAADSNVAKEPEQPEN